MRDGPPDRPPCQKPGQKGIRARCTLPRPPVYPTSPRPDVSDLLLSYRKTPHAMWDEGFLPYSQAARSALLGQDPYPYEQNPPTRLQKAQETPTSPWTSWPPTRARKSRAWAGLPHRPQGPRLGPPLPLPHPGLPPTGTLTPGPQALPHPGMGDSPLPQEDPLRGPAGRGL